MDLVEGLSSDKIKSMKKTSNDGLRELIKKKIQEKIQEKVREKVQKLEIKHSLVNENSD